MKALAQQEVLVGFPEESTERDDDPLVKGDEPTNAELGYIHDNGAPEANIPARPFMVPGIENARDPVTRHLYAGAKRVLQTRSAADAENALERAGLAAVTAIKRKINEGVPPPLAEMTLRMRASRGRKGAQAELDHRAQGGTPGVDLAKPLIDTAQMRNAVNYVIRARRERK